MSQSERIEHGQHHHLAGEYRLKWDVSLYLGSGLQGKHDGMALDDGWLFVTKLIIHLPTWLLGWQSCPTITYNKH